MHRSNGFLDEYEQLDVCCAELFSAFKYGMFSIHGTRSINVWIICTNWPVGRLKILRQNPSVLLYLYHLLNFLQPEQEWVLIEWRTLSGIIFDIPWDERYLDELPLCIKVRTAASEIDRFWDIGSNILPELFGWSHWRRAEIIISCFTDFTKSSRRYLVDKFCFVDTNAATNGICWALSKYANLLESISAIAPVGQKRFKPI